MREGTRLRDDLAARAREPLARDDVESRVLAEGVGRVRRRAALHEVHVRAVVAGVEDEGELLGLGGVLELGLGLEEDEAAPPAQRARARSGLRPRGVAWRRGLRRRASGGAVGAPLPARRLALADALLLLWHHPTEHGAEDGAQLALVQRLGEGVGAVALPLEAERPRGAQAPGELDGAQDDARRLEIRVERGAKLAARLPCGCKHE